MLRHMPIHLVVSLVVPLLLSREFDDDIFRSLPQEARASRKCMQGHGAFVDVFEGESQISGWICHSMTVRRQYETWKYCPSTDGVLVKVLQNLRVGDAGVQERSTGGLRGHVPYRNSTMTMVLRDSLGGNCRTVMVANITAQHEMLDESISTCRFAQRVALVANHVSPNFSLALLLLMAGMRAPLSCIGTSCRRHMDPSVPVLPFSHRVYIDMADRIWSLILMGHVECIV